MALNIFPRRKELEKQAAAPEQPEALPEPSPETMAALDDGAEVELDRHPRPARPAASVPG